MPLRGNAVVTEWADLTDRYLHHQAFHDALLRFVHDIADLRAYFHFYGNYTRGDLERLFTRGGGTDQDQTLRLRPALRPLSAVARITPNASADGRALSIAGLELENALRVEIDRLIASKVEFD